MAAAVPWAAPADAMQQLQSSAQIQVRFEKVKSNKILDKVVPATFMMDVPLHAKVDSLPSMIKDVMLARIMPGETILKELQKTERIIKFSCRLEVPGWGAVLLDGKSRFDEVQDLYQGTQHNDVEILAEVSLQRLPEGPDSVEDCVQIPVKEERRQYLRIGNLPVWIRSLNKYQDQRTAGPGGPGYCWPILVTYNEDLTAFTCSWIHAYDFDDFCMGDVNERGLRVLSEYDANWRCGIFSLMGTYVETEEEFLARLRKHIEAGASSQLTGMPFLPTYCLAPWDPRKHDHLVLKKWPKSNVEIAVTIVNRHTDFDGVTFPRDIRWAIDEPEEVSQICHAIMKDMNTQGVRDGIPVDSTRLFNKQDRKKWCLALWVMPQFGPRKLFRYVEGNVLQFLDGTNKVRPTDKKLYVEAHVVPRVDS
ncbi:hypothetical protein CLAFUR4_03831 [Fulvia fulva]|nr:hypothetical protein CLAFUR4_03831 [Fulvia fulva]WPV26790.1 hypothetical protein CLAFUW7_03835 [Fulvia fulva]